MDGDGEVCVHFADKPPILIFKYNYLGNLIQLSGRYLIYDI